MRAFASNDERSTTVVTQAPVHRNFSMVPIQAAASTATSNNDEAPDSYFGWAVSSRDALVGITQPAVGADNRCLTRTKSFSDSALVCPLITDGAVAIKSDIAQSGSVVAFTSDSS